MKTRYALLVVAALFAAAGACSKKSSSSNSTNGNIDITGKTKQQVFMMQKWKVGAWVDSNQLGITDALDPCDKDDSYNFTTTTSYTLDRGACKNSGDAQTESDPWSMASANATDVTIWGVTYTIQKQTSTAITLTRNFIQLGYDTKETVTLGKY